MTTITSKIGKFLTQSELSHMKIVTQNFKTGKLSLADVPAPRVNSKSILVRTHASLISAGTERAAISMAQKNYMGKAMERPDLVRKVINKAKTEGLMATYKVVQNRISEPMPLGYSLVGEVIAVGSEINEVSVGDRVACAGAKIANHAEIVAIPRNLFVPVPDNVDDEQACYVTLGAIAMHGVRQADQQFGATVLVVGLGLVGQITVQICHAAGYRVIGMDLDARKLNLAKQNGAVAAFTPDDNNLAAAIAHLTNGYGVDAVLLTASSKDSGAVFAQIANLCRDRARVVVVGDIKMDIDRRTYFQKELEILQSRSYGPGRYDANYEDKGQDYPIGYVRWTERRNLRSFLDLIADGRINMHTLTTHHFPLQQAEHAYDMIMKGSHDLIIGVVLTYEQEKVTPNTTPKIITKQKTSGKIGLGIIGTGQFASGVLIPALINTKEFNLIGVASARGLSAHSVKDRYQAQFATSNALEILDHNEINAVVIATRHDSHAKYIIEALKRDKHVFVEKPLCLNENDLYEIESVAQKSKGVLSVGYNRRFSPFISSIKEFFNGRSEPMSMLYRVNCGRIPVEGEGAWLHDPYVGGGRIMGEVCHFVDTLQAICQARPQTVSCFGINPQRSDLANDDIVTLQIGFDDGSAGTIHYWSNGDSSFPKEYCEVFSQGKIASLHNYRKLELISNNKSKFQKTMNQAKGYAEEASAFLNACRSGEPAVPLQSLIDTTLVTLRAVEDLRGFTRPEIVSEIEAVI